MSSRLSKVLSLLLGIQMFMFGFLKFFQPIRGWFDIQIQQSHLPHEAIIAGKLTEMVTGVLFLLPWLWRSLTSKSKDQILLIACFDPVYSDDRGNLCPPAAWRACQRSSSGYQTACDSGYGSPSGIAHCFRCLEAAASRESQRNATSVTEFAPNHFWSERGAGVPNLTRALHSRLITNYCIVEQQEHDNDESLRICSARIFGPGKSCLHGAPHAYPRRRRWRAERTRGNLLLAARFGWTHRDRGDANLAHGQRLQQYTRDSFP